MSDGFRHVAVLYEGLGGFIDTTVPIIEEGLTRDEAVVVMASADRIDRLRDELGPPLPPIDFLDTGRMGRNPARLLFAWDDLATESTHNSHRLRGIGDVGRLYRRPEEHDECTLNESLVNRAFADRSGFALWCAYESSIDHPKPAVESALTSHPEVLVDGTCRPNDRFEPDSERHSLGSPLLPSTPGWAETITFDQAGLSLVRAATRGAATRAGVVSTRIRDLELAVSEVATNSVRHGGGHGIARIWPDDHWLICEIADDGEISDPLVGRHRPDRQRAGGSFGLWLAHQLCDLVRIRSQPGQGTTVRLYTDIAPQDQGAAESTST